MAARRPKSSTCCVGGSTVRKKKSCNRRSRRCSALPTIAYVSSDTAGLFGPGSMVWTIDREVAVLLGSGSRALLLQVAHPLVAAAVANHSRYRSDPLGRLRDTLDAIYAFAFEDLPRVHHVVEGVNRLHSAVRGSAPDGRAYFAL